MKISKKKINQILDEVPTDYYQKGVKNNLLQRIWHNNKLKITKTLIKKSYINILDVGCASGWFLSQIAKEHRKANCYGIDLYKKAIIYGNKKYKNLKLIHADAHKLPFQNNFFDLIICHEVLEHVIDPNKVLKEIKRVVNKKGNVIIEMDSGNKLFKLVWKLWIKYGKHVWKEAHLREFNEKKLEIMIKNNGFKILKKRKFNWTMAVILLLKPHH